MVRKVEDNLFTYLGIVLFVVFISLILLEVFYRGIIEDFAVILFISFLINGRLNCIMIILLLSILLVFIICNQFFFTSIVSVSKPILLSVSQHNNSFCNNSNQYNQPSLWNDGNSLIALVIE